MVAADEAEHVQCPQCGKEVPVRSEERGEYFPFCSRKCKLLDLGKWFDEEYRISEERPGSSSGDGGRSENELKGGRG